MKSIEKKKIVDFIERLQRLEESEPEGRDYFLMQVGAIEMLRELGIYVYIDADGKWKVENAEKSIKSDKKV